MNKELQQHKKSDTVKWVLTLIAFILAFVMLAGLTMQVFAADKLKPSEWFKKPEQTEQLPDASAQTKGGMILSEVTSGTGIALMSAPIDEEDYEDYGISTQADSAFTVTAEVQPENATDKRVTWSVTWKNSSSSWASGKTVTNYVTVTPTTIGALTASVACTQAFGEVVVLTVTSMDDTTVSATQEINYMKRATSFDCYSTSPSGGRGSLTVGKTGADASSLICNPTYGVGTVTGTVSITSAKLTFSTTYCNMSSYISSANAVAQAGVKISAATSKTFSNPSSSSGGLALAWSDFFVGSGAGLFAIGTQATNHLKSGIVGVSKNGAPGYGTLSVSIKITYGSVSETYTQEATVTKLDTSAIAVGVNSISYTGGNSALTF